MKEVCYAFICFVPPVKSDIPRIFGFAEFIAALALLVITYTLVDVRYRFRLAIAPSPLYRRTFGVIGFIGAATLLSEVWLAQGWWLPKTAYLTRFIWQGYLGLLFLATFMTWVWYAYIRPPIYNRRNCRPYAQALLGYIVRGSDSELAVIADELRRSARALVNFASDLPSRYFDPKEHNNRPQISPVEGLANDVLQLIANRKLCRHIVGASPATAIEFFEAAAAAKKYRLALGTFAKNLTAEAVRNPDSLLYHEVDPFSSGLLGHLQPFSKAIYGHYKLVDGLAERFGSPLDLEYQEAREWTAHQWKAYGRAVCTTLAAYLKETKGWQHSYPLTRAIDSIEHSFMDAYRLQDIATDYYSTDTFQRLAAAVDFVRDAVEVIDKQNPPPGAFELRRRSGNYQRDIYDALAGLMFELIDAASAVSGPPDKAWAIHYNAVWGQFFSLSSTTRAWKILQFKLRRLLFDEIASIEKLPNFKNARFLGVCLNVTGLKIGTGSHGREYRALARVILPLAQRCYPRLRRELPRVADAVLLGGITYDVEQNCLVKTYLQGLRNEPSREYLELTEPE